MRNIYKDQIIDHYKHPRNFGLPSLKLRRSERLVTIRETNASCGDMIELRFKWKQGEIDEIKFTGEGCAISIAATSMLIEKIKSSKLKAKSIMRLTEKDIVKMLGIKISPTRMKCAILPIQALKKALTAGI